MKTDNPLPANSRGRKTGGSARRADGVVGRSKAKTKPAPQPRPFSAEELRQISAEISADWHPTLETNRLTLMEIDPWRVHAYWHLNEAALAAARDELPAGGNDADLVLRFTDLSPGEAAAPHAPFDIQVQRANNNWYVDLWRDAKHYSAELGLRSGGGEFITLARSNAIRTPRSGPSPELDFQHLEVRPAATSLPRKAAGPDLSGILLRDLFPQRVPAGDGFPLALPGAPASVPEEPPFPEIPAFAPEAAAPLRDAVTDSEMKTDAETESQPVGTEGFPQVDSAEIDPYRAEAKRLRRKLLAGLKTTLPSLAESSIAPTHLDLPSQPLNLPPSATRTGPPRQWQPVAAGISQEGAPKAGPSEPALPPSPPPRSSPGPAPVFRLPVPLEALLSQTPSSFDPSLSGTQVSARLVISGQAEPGVNLTLFGQPVATQADGRFAADLALPRGPELAALLHHMRALAGAKEHG